MTRIKGEVKVVSIFDLAFDRYQKYIKAVTSLTSPLAHVKGEVKHVVVFDLAFVPSQRCMQSRYTFDITFDARQR